MIRLSLDNLEEVIKQIAREESKIPSPKRNFPDKYLGNTYSRLTVLKTYYFIDTKRERWALCKCLCGTLCKVRIGSLVAKNTKSCGCLVLEPKGNLGSFKHGLRNHRIYKIWSGIKRRCTKSTASGYVNYGARGINIYDEWLNNFQSFYDWSMNNNYSEDKSIDRIDNDGNYCPENCRWATNSQQANNKRNNRIFEYKGEYLTMSQLVKKYGKCSISLFGQRFREGWRDLDALLSAPGTYKRNTQNGKSI